jgi:hypothetical protein
MRRSSPVLLLAVVAALAVVLAACGGTTVASPSPTSAAPTATPTPTERPTPTPEPTPAVDPDLQELVDAALASVEEGTVRIDQTAEFNGSTVIPDGTAISAVGQAAFGKPRQMRLVGDFTALEIGEVELILDDTVMYMRGEFVAQLGVEDGQWVRVDLESNHPAAASFGGLTTGSNDVSLAVFYLLGATGDVDVEEGDVIRGETTRHYEAEVDLEAARELVPEDSAESLEDNIAALRVGGIDRTFQAEAWVGEDGLVLRTRYVLKLGRAQGGGEVEQVYDFSDYGEPMELGIPDAADIVDIEDLAPS